mmetsp:Transcript_90488/g.180608  ORF Transcript_90488/g.180608 Transcript_90488/m.180608 type:complete len:135 (-) Transcript_90488:29-433(-)
MHQQVNSIVDPEGLLDSLRAKVPDLIENDEFKHVTADQIWKKIIELRGKFAIVEANVDKSGEAGDRSAREFHRFCTSDRFAMAMMHLKKAHLQLTYCTAAVPPTVAAVAGVASLGGYEELHPNNYFYPLMAHQI